MQWNSIKFPGFYIWRYHLLLQCMKRHGNVLRIDREWGITWNDTARWAWYMLSDGKQWEEWLLAAGQCHGREQATDVAGRGEVRSHRCEGKIALFRSQDGWKEQQWQEELSTEWAEAVGTTWPWACCKQSMKWWCTAWRWVLPPSYSSGWPQGAYGPQGLWMEIRKDVIKRSTVVLAELPSLDAGIWKHIIENWLALNSYTTVREFRFHM